MIDKIKSTVTVILCAAFALCIFITQLATPAKQSSDSERRLLARMPEFSMNAVLSGKFANDFDNYAMDRFPLRDKFRSLRAISNQYVFMQSDKDKLYYHNGHLSKLEYPLDVNSVKGGANKFKSICEKYAGDDTNIYCSLIPDKNYFMAGEGYPSIDYDELKGVFRDNTQPMKYIDIFDLLELSDYYKTDSHWRQEKIIDVAKRLTAEMGGEITEDFEVNTLDKDFYGVYHGQMALPLPAEKMNYLTSPTINACRAYDYEGNEYSGVYNMELAHGRDPYEMFLSGSKGLIKITNPLAQNGRRLIIFRDSFASSIAPILACAYSETVLVDIRYISSNALGALIDFNGCDILFLYSTLVLNNSITLK